jgi:hypothetical protein
LWNDTTGIHEGCHGSLYKNGDQIEFFNIFMDLHLCICGAIDLGQKEFSATVQTGFVGCYLIMITSLSKEYSF